MSLIFNRIYDVVYCLNQKKKHFHVYHSPPWHTRMKNFVTKMHFNRTSWHYRDYYRLHCGEIKHLVASVRLPVSLLTISYLKRLIGPLARRLICRLHLFWLEPRPHDSRQSSVSCNKDHYQCSSKSSMRNGDYSLLWASFHDYDYQLQAFPGMIMDINSRNCGKQAPKVLKSPFCNY